MGGYSNFLMDLSSEVQHTKNSGQLSNAVWKHTTATSYYLLSAEGNLVRIGRLVESLTFTEVQRHTPNLSLPLTIHCSRSYWSANSVLKPSFNRTVNPIFVQLALVQNSTDTPHPPPKYCSNQTRSVYAGEPWCPSRSQHTLPVSCSGQGNRNLAD